MSINYGAVGYRTGLEVVTEPDRLEAIDDREREGYEAVISAVGEMIDRAEANNYGPLDQVNLEQMSLRVESGVSVSFYRIGPGEDFELDIFTEDDESDDFDPYAEERHGIPTDFEVTNDVPDSERFARSIITGGAVNAFGVLLGEVQRGDQDGTLIESAATYCYESTSSWFNKVSGQWEDETVYDEVRVTREVSYKAGACSEIVIDMELRRHVSDEGDYDSHNVTDSAFVQIQRIRIVPQPEGKPVIEAGYTQYWEDANGAVNRYAPYSTIVSSAAAWGSRDQMLEHLGPEDWRKLVASGAEDYGLVLPASEEEDDDYDGSDWEGDDFDADEIDDIDEDDDDEDGEEAEQNHQIDRS